MKLQYPRFCTSRHRFHEKNKWYDVQRYQYYVDLPTESYMKQLQ